MPSKYTTEIFIKKAKLVHQNKYSYELVNYINSKTKVLITCPVHGTYWQMPNNHLNSKGCPKCSGNVKYNDEEFIRKAQLVHGTKYNYSQVNYINNITEITIQCSKHGGFSQKPISHLLGHECKKCADDARRKYPTELTPLITKVRNCVFNSYKRKGFTKRSHTSDLLGCTWEQFKEHLEDNPYNFKITDPDMDLDHITPIASAETEEDIYRLNHYTNFQLLPADYNRWVKSCKLFDKEHFESWLEENEYLLQ